MECTKITIQSCQHSRNSNFLPLKAKYRNVAKFLIMTLFSVDSKYVHSLRYKTHAYTDTIRPLCRAAVENEAYFTLCCVQF